MSASVPIIRVAVVDDESHARSRLRQLLKDAPEFELVAECTNGQEALDCIRESKPDLVFLDIQIPRLNGFQVCEALLAQAVPLPCIVFVTAFDEYAVKAFELHALDYLLKPFDRERFRRCLDRIVAQFRTRPATVDPGLQAVLQDIQQHRKVRDRLVFKQNGKVIFIRPESIDWIESDGNYVKVRAGSDSHHLRETLADIEAQLPPRHFMRISRSTIVNLNRVKEMQPLFYGDYAVILNDGSKLSMSRSYRDRLEALLLNREQ